VRILESKFLLGGTFLILILLALCLINLILYTRYRRNHLTVSVHIISFFAMILVFCNIIDFVILDLEFERIYRAISTAAGILILVSVMVSAAVLIKNKEEGIALFGFSSDCKSIFKEAHDLALIADYNGLIIDVNHSDQLNEICARANTMNEALLPLKECANPPIPEFPNEIRSNMRFETYLKDRDVYYLIRVLPILSGGVRIGYTVLIQDVSDMKKSECMLSEQNRALEDANRKLSHYVTVASALEAEKKRLQIFEHLQMTLIEKIKDAIFRIGEIQKKSQQKQACQDDIKATAAQLRGIYKDVRTSVGQIAGKDIAQ